MLWQACHVTALLLGLRFVWELCLLAAMGVIGVLAFSSLPLKIVGCAVLVLVTAAVWGVLLSPRRRIDLSLGVRVAVELILFATAAGGLMAAGLAAWGIALIVGEVVIVSALAAMGLPPGSDASRR